MYNNPNYFSYQNPAYYSYMATRKPKLSFFSKFKNGINWNSLLNNTSKTLNLINQAIPVYYQVRPLIKNCSTLFKIADIIKMDDFDEKTTQKKEQADTEKQKEDKFKSSSEPTFFL